MAKILRCSRFLDAQDVQMLKCDDLNSNLCCKSSNSTLFVNNTEEERSVDVDCRLCVGISYYFFQILVDIDFDCKLCKAIMVIVYLWHKHHAGGENCGRSGSLTSLLVDPGHHCQS